MSRIHALIASLFIFGSLLAQEYEYRIAKQCNQVDSVYELILDYQNIGIKETGKSGFDSATRWLSDNYSSMGYTTVIDSFSTSYGPSANVIIEKRGVDTNSWVIIGAHYDTKGSSLGANDNGSGVAATFEIARLIKDIGTNLSVRIINFGAEEQGYLGSFHYANNVLDPLENVVLMFNIDQLGGSKGKNNKRIVCERDQDNSPSVNNVASFFKTDTLARMMELYTTIIPVYGNIERSDYEPFQDLGYVVTGLYQESQDDHNHRSTDLVSNMDTEATTEVIKGALAATLYFAGINITVDVSEKKQEQVTIFPNPASGQFSLNFQDAKTRIVQVHGLTGEEVKRVEVTGNSLINIADLSPGSYTVRISLPFSGDISYSKLIIAR